MEFQMAKAITKEGFFNMEIVTAVCNEKDLVKAKQIALDRVEATKADATPENIRKAINMIEKATTIKNLGLSITNFMFAHPSENLKTIR
jgi:isopropylmalate/homocitrate/citramalate synthase